MWPKARPSEVTLPAFRILVVVVVVDASASVASSVVVVVVVEEAIPPIATSSASPIDHPTRPGRRRGDTGRMPARPSPRGPR